MRDGDATALTATESLARFTNALDADSTAPASVRQAVVLHLLDALGCGLAAVGLDAAPYGRSLGAESGPGPATALGVQAPVPPATAALVNGISAHALDFDDTHPGSIAHVSAVVAPAALAAGQAVGASGRQLAGALLAGNEVTCRIGRPAADAFHLRGFHATPICGVFGAVAAVAKLSDLDVRRTVNALGIAGSMASGLLAFLSDGSATKQLHPGWMAHAAHVAVELAAHGATGPAAILEGQSGVYSAFIDRHDVDVEELTSDLGSVWETPNIAFKPYPACHFLHAPLDALAQLKADRDLDLDAIERVTVFEPRAGIELTLEPLERKRRPATTYEAKFSAPFAVGALLTAGRVDAATFDSASLSDSRIQAIADRVDYEERSYDSFPESLPGGVRIALTGGEQLELHLLHQRGGALNPMGFDEIVAKFRRNAGIALPDAAVSGLEEAVLHLDEQSDLRAIEVLADAAGPRS
jgi:2-methylcitrate dehydratase PrpD